MVGYALRLRASASTDWSATSSLSRRASTAGFAFCPPRSRPTTNSSASPLDDAYHLGVLSSRIHVAWALATGSRLGVGIDPSYVKTKCFETFAFPDATADQCDALAPPPKPSTLTARPASKSIRPDVHRPLQRRREAARGRGATGKDTRVHDDGLVSTLVTLHDRLDALVAAAYGWPAGLDEQQILESSSPLTPPAAGGSRRTRALPASGLSGAGRRPSRPRSRSRPLTRSSEASNQKPWPETAAERAQSVMRILRESSDPMNVEAVATRFKRARRSDVTQLLDISVALGQARQVDGLYAS